MTTFPPLPVQRCEECRARSASPRTRCAQCGSARLSSGTVEPRGVVLAATELAAPSAGWTAPHRLALVEIDRDVRVLAMVVGPLPGVGAAVEVRATGGRFEAVAPL